MRARTHIVAGIVLAVAAGLMVILSSALGLEIESVALLGAALGAVVALVPDRGPAARLLAFFAGFVVAWLGYALRAAVLPDSDGGRAAAVVTVVLLCVGVLALSGGRLPLWGLLLGTAALTGAYEFTFAAAPPELLTTSLDTATTLFLSVAVGFCAAALATSFERGRGATDETAPSGPGPDPIAEQRSDAARTESDRLTVMMGSTK